MIEIFDLQRKVVGSVKLFNKWKHKRKVIQRYQKWMEIREHDEMVKRVDKKLKEQAELIDWEEYEKDQERKKLAKEIAKEMRKNDVWVGGPK